MKNIISVFICMLFILSGCNNKDINVNQYLAIPSNIVTNVFEYEYDSTLEGVIYTFTFGIQLIFPSEQFLYDAEDEKEGYYIELYSDDELIDRISPSSINVVSESQINSYQFLFDLEFDNLDLKYNNVNKYKFFKGNSIEPFFESNLISFEFKELDDSQIKLKESRNGLYFVNTIINNNELLLDDFYLYTLNADKQDDKYLETILTISDKYLIDEEGRLSINDISTLSYGIYSIYSNNDIKYMDYRSGTTQVVTITDDNQKLLDYLISINQ